MKVSQVSNLQSFNGNLRAYHNTKKKMFYGAAAGCALLAAVCGFSYAKDANPNGYRSSTHASKQISAKDFLLVFSGLTGLIGSLFSLKKADDERELEDIYKAKESFLEKKRQKEFNYIETPDKVEHKNKSNNMQNSNSIEKNKTKYFSMYKR